MTIHDGSLVVAGSFTTAGGLTANRIARWDGTTWTPLGTGLGGTSPIVYALAVFNGELIAGGTFTTAGGVSANRIARWNGTTWQSLGSGMSGSTSPFVYAIAEYNGELIAAGGFTSAGGVSVARIARWNGTTWQGLGAGITGGSPPYVKALMVNEGELIAGGFFQTAGATSAFSIARWNNSVWQPLGTGVSFPTGTGFQQSIVSALAAHNGELNAGGNFAIAGGNVSAYWSRWGPDCPRGDMNCDQTLDQLDIPLFVDASLAAPELSLCAAYTANVNGDVMPDGRPRIDGTDVGAFVSCLLVGGCP